jgi:hypothetical protein
MADQSFGVVIGDSIEQQARERQRNADLFACCEGSVQQNLAEPATDEYQGKP